MHSDAGKPYRELTAFATDDWSPQVQSFDRAALAKMTRPPGIIKVEPDAFDDLELLGDEEGTLYKADPRPIRGRVLFDGNPVLRMYEAPEGAILRKMGSGCDELIHVSTGRLLVVDQSGRRGEIAAGSAIVLTGSFQGEIELGKDFRGTVAAVRWPGASDPAATFCPKF